MGKTRGIAIVLLAGTVAGACSMGGFARKEIEGNNTGGVIPWELASGKSVQALAEAHCTKYGTRARVTFDGTSGNTDTVFVCETASGPALYGAPKGSPTAAASAPATPAPTQR